MVKDKWLIAESVDGVKQYIVHPEYPRFIAGEGGQMTKTKNTKKAEWDALHTHVALKKETVARLRRLGSYGETLDIIVSRAIEALERGEDINGKGASDK